MQQYLWAKHWYCKGCRSHFYRSKTCLYCDEPLVDLSKEADYRAIHSEEPDELRRVSVQGTIHGHLSGSAPDGARDKRRDRN